MMRFIFVLIRRQVTLALRDTVKYAYDKLKFAIKLPCRFIDTTMKHQRELNYK